MPNMIRRLRVVAVEQIALLLFHWPKVFRAKFRRAFSERKSVLEMVEGERTFPGGRWAIFLIWQPKQTPWYVQNALDALATANTNVLLVVNHELSAERRCELIAQSAKIMIRDNSGFDIGGYQDATLYLNNAVEVERLLYLNDSVYFFRGGLAKFFERLTSSKSDVCSAFENWEIHYHLQSFCFSLSGQMLKHPKFIEFWENYLPVNSRVWAINQGEVGISRALLSIASSFDVVYTPPAIKAHIAKLSKNELVDLDNFLPRHLRIGIERSGSLPVSVLAREICDRISTMSQIHTGVFIFRRFIGCPIMKRDLVYRLQFTLYDVQDLLQIVGDEGYTAEILSDMRRKGVGTQLRGLKRLQFAAGIL